jgi:hypothetical protein
MPYILKKTNGQTLTTVQDASVDNSTGLTFVGRNYSGYGQPVEENFVKLLENFANTTAPAKPVQGQLWFNNAPNSRRLLVSYDGKSFRDVSNVPYSTSAPKNATTGDLWWDSLNSQIKVYDSVTDTWTASQPNGGAGSAWDFGRILDSDLVERNSIKAVLGGYTTLNISATEYVPDGSANLPQFPIVKKGITLTGADPVTGVSATSTSSNYIFWGTAADALKSQHIDISSNTTTATYYLTFATGTSGTQTLYARSNISYNPTTDVLNVTAASALYADIAERYESDAVYEPGTVLMLGGEKEVTLACYSATTAVAGIVSTKPAYMLNSEAGSDETHPFIALKGRVPCKICGPVKKGDILVSSGDKPGYACVADPTYSVHPAAIIGKALENFEGSFGVIEVKV